MSLTDDQLDTLAIDIIKRIWIGCKWIMIQYGLLFLFPFAWGVMPTSMPLYIILYTISYNFYWEFCHKKERIRYLWAPYIGYLFLGVLCCFIGLIHFSFFGLLLSPLYGAVCYIAYRVCKKLSIAMKISVGLGIVVVAVVMKMISVGWSCKDLDDFQQEKTEILQRRNFLTSKLMVKPYKVISEMPYVIGNQFQGEWALYSCSMFTESLVNISRLYPETKEENLQIVDSLIKIVLSPELREYDTQRWREDALESLDSSTSHLSYISHLAWMIGGYKSLGGNDQYDKLYKALCEALNRRILQSPAMNIPTYPGEPIYVPDMLVAIVALKQYALPDKSEYEETVDKWIARARNEWTDSETGLLVSFLDEEGYKIQEAPVRGSYSALNCYYLTLIDTTFANEQYSHLKACFYKSSFPQGLREYRNSSPLLALDVDAGPILLGLSPSGTAFATGPATFFDDKAVRSSILRTAEIAGSTISCQDKRHYALTDMALVGEAVMLAMRTNGVD